MSGSIRKGVAAALGALAIGVPACVAALSLSFDDYEEEPIKYSATAPKDPIADLQKRIDSGQVKLTYDEAHGYLPAVLRELHIPVSSQMLVFSKTSFQRDLISPDFPRAVYFNDNTYIGWVQGGPVVEVSTVDPQLGAVFYVLRQDPNGKPKFIRQTHECLQCHDSNLARGVPGHIMRSVIPDRTGQPILTAGSYLTTDQSPIKERWGGWYVTGKHGIERHMGNLSAGNAAEADNPNLNAGANVMQLATRVNVAPYLGKFSDIVALMVAEHQTNVQNLITRANYETRRALHYEAALNKDLNRPAGYRSESTLSRIKSVCEPLVKAMLFSKEATLASPITGASGFGQQFAAYGPRDTQGRSLRDLDLQKRLFKYPCSFQIYSDAFNGLPTITKNYIFRRVDEVLTGKDKTEDFSNLNEGDRKAILEILAATKPDFAAWKSASTNRQGAKNDKDSF